MEDNQGPEIPDGLAPGEPEEVEEGDSRFEITPARCPVCEALAVLPKDENTIRCIMCEAEWDDPTKYRAELAKARVFKIDVKHAGFYFVRNGLPLATALSKLAATEPAKEIGRILRGLFS